jgi:hypothetical protein
MSLVFYTITLIIFIRPTDHSPNKFWEFGRTNNFLTPRTQLIYNITTQTTTKDSNKVTAVRKRYHMIDDSHRNIGEGQNIRFSDPKPIL